MTDRVRLLHAPYTAPVPRRGTPSRCLIRGRITVVGWTDAKLSWPLCTLPGRGGAPSIQVDAELARAVRHESAVAIRHWWGVTAKVVARWRRALGVTRTNCEGSRRLIQAAARAGAAVIKANVWTAAERRARSRRAIELGLGRNLDHSPTWTAEQVGLLHMLSDAAVAERTGRTANAVRQARVRYGIAAVGAIVRRRWTAAELRLLRSGMHYLEIARLTGRTALKYD